jgi:hypothetical protein
MRRVVAIVLVSCAAAAATLALGSALASGPATTGAQAVHPAHLSAAASPLAGLNRTFRRIAPSARCDAAAGKARTARGLRAAALKNAAKASPKVLRAKKKKLRRAIRLLRSAAELCEATAPPGGSPGNGAPPAPNPYPPPGPAPSPPPPGTQTRAFTASGVLAFNPSTAQTASASAPILLQLTNNSGSVGHNIGLRTAPPPPQTVRAGPSTTVFGPNEVTSVVIPAGTLAPGTYQIFCARPGHATPTTGMIVPLTVVTP